MPYIIITASLIFIVSTAFSIFGKGGGEFYLPIIITLLAIPLYQAAGISLFIIFIQSLSMVAIYHRKHRLIDWPVALVMALVVGSMAFLGGYISFKIPAIYLKSLFAGLLLVSAYFLFLNKKVIVKKDLLVWPRKVNNNSYDCHLLYTLIPVGLIALLAGMVGISGGGLIVPLCIILGGMPLRLAMGSNTFLVLVSSSTGFLGHLAKGGINWKLAFIFGLMALTGSQIGARMHIGIKEKHLRLGLSSLLALAAFWMILKIFV